MFKHIVSQFAIKYVYTILNSCNCVIHMTKSYMTLDMTDMYLTIHIQHNTVVYLTLNVYPNVETTALKTYSLDICLMYHDLFRQQSDVA
jgi:hypothetical protein